MTIHTYTSAEPMMHVNAYIVEGAKELVIIDATLTMSDSKALKQRADALGKPIAGILVTHAHPDHIAGLANLAPYGEMPIYSLQSVRTLMADTEAAKHKQWSSLFGAEWVPKWVYPNRIVADGETVVLAGVRFTVVDLGSGGDCDANSMWLMEDANKAAFVGDFLYVDNHTYMNDGSILRWLANLDRFTPVLKEFSTYYVGHGTPGDQSSISKQKEYFTTYCGNVLAATGGKGTFTDESRKTFEQKMLAAYPGYGCGFMVGLSCDRVGKELLSLSHGSAIAK